MDISLKNDGCKSLCHYLHGHCELWQWPTLTRQTVLLFLATKCKTSLSLVLHSSLFKIARTWKQPTNAPESWGQGKNCIWNSRPNSEQMCGPTMVEGFAVWVVRTVFLPASQSQALRVPNPSSPTTLPYPILCPCHFITFFLSLPDPSPAHF